jgi:hypothetical protein
MPIDLVALGVRHQIMLEGLKAGQSNVLFNNILDLSNALQNRLRTVTFENLGDMRKVDLTILLMDLRKIANGVFNYYLNSLIKWLQDYISADREFWQVALSAYKDPVVYERAKEDKKHEFVALPFTGAPKAETIFSYAKNNPIGANGALPLDFAQGFLNLASGRIAQETAKAFANVETKSQLLDALIGDMPTFGGAKAKGKQDSLLNLLARQGDAMQRTVIQHFAAATNMKVAATGFAQYLWVSVIDGHTTVICMDRNGNVYVYGEGPEPPAHIGCRSSTVPFDGTGPVTMPSFTMWANGQGEEYLNAAFDGEPGSAYEGNARAIDLETFTANRSLIIA